MGCGRLGRVVLCEHRLAQSAAIQHLADGLATSGLTHIVRPICFIEHPSTRRFCDAILSANPTSGIEIEEGRNRSIKLYPVEGVFRHDRRG